MNGGMSARLRCIELLLALAGLSLAAGAAQRAPASASPPLIAYAIVDIASGRTLSMARPDVLQATIVPGSVIKIAALMAALDSGTIEPGTSIRCRRDIEIDGHRVTCAHPDLGRPLHVSEALAHSCNDFVATMARRLPRAAFDRALGQLGLPPVAAGVPLELAAIGLGGIGATPEQLLRGFVRLVRAPSPVAMRASTREVLIEGLRGCATYGSGAAFAEAGLSALAKTGTAPMPGGGTEGLVVAAAPADAPARAVVVVAPGAAGKDAAAIAARLLLAGDDHGAQAGPSLRVGRARQGGGYDITTLELEDYVARVVAAEQAPASRPAALDALAIAVRTFALANLGRHESEGFDLCDLTHCQVVGRATGTTRAAAARTRGLVLLYRGAPAPIFYHASCGGYTERPSTAWPGSSDLPFLLSGFDPWCVTVPRWTNDVRAGDLERAARAAGLRGDRLLELAVAANADSGRVTRVRLRGFLPEVTTGEDFRLAIGRTLGWNVLKSTMFTITRTAAGYRFTGKGSGHGVGLCITGSARQASAGRSAKQILAAYFPGLEIGPLAVTSSAIPDSGAATPHVLVSLPAGEEGERTRIAALAARAAAEIARKAGVAPPTEIRLEFHPTIEAYQRETGQPWWTSATTRGAAIDLLPLSTLRRRGILEPTIRHEVAHLVTAPRLAGRPLWVVEGAAIYFAGEPAAPAGNAACPADDELASSRSAEALGDAHSRAAACFARAIASGRSWQAVR